MMHDPGIIRLNSPNFNDRIGNDISLIVLHCTECATAQEAIDIWLDPVRELSTHYFLQKDQTIYQHVPIEKKAWHAGRDSCWQGVPLVNNYSIGIELDNNGHEDYPQGQIDRLIDLLEFICHTYKISKHRIVAHADVIPDRKTDPGLRFPWHYLAKKGFGLWPEGPCDPQQLSVAEGQALFQKIGYDCPETGDVDQKTLYVIRSFQIRFMQEISAWDEKTMGRLVQVASLFNETSINKTRFRKAE